MPHSTALIDGRGPLMQVVVTISAARRAALQAAGQPVPAPVVATMLIDTGAGVTCVDKTVVQRLQLQPTGSMAVNTPSTGTTPHQCSTFDVDILMPATTDMKHLPSMQVVEADFSAQGHQGLIGRDILKDFRMTYSGPDKIVWLSY